MTIVFYPDEPSFVTELTHFLEHGTEPTSAFNLSVYRSLKWWFRRRYIPACKKHRKRYSLDEDDCWHETLIIATDLIPQEGEYSDQYATRIKSAFKRARKVGTDGQSKEDIADECGYSADWASHDFEIDLREWYERYPSDKGRQFGYDVCRDKSNGFANADIGTTYGIRKADIKPILDFARPFLERYRVD